MDYRQRKQNIIVLILTIFLIAVLVGVYFIWFYHAPTCFDGKQNQEETGVDCGGSCMSCERLTIKELQVEWAKYVLLENKSYDLAAKINNPNPNYGLGLFKYTFSLFDAENNLIQEKKGTDFILPAESKYLVEANIKIEKELGKVVLKIEPAAVGDWQKLQENYESPNIYIHDKKISLPSEKETQTQISGIIKNDSLFDFDRILVTAALFDKNQELIGVNKTEARTVLAGEDRYFSTVWFTPIKGEIVNVDMKSETNLFLDANFMRRFGAQEKFQQY
jgi:hypothetical protein